MFVTTENIIKRPVFPALHLKQTSKALFLIAVHWTKRVESKILHIMIVQAPSLSDVTQNGRISARYHIKQISCISQNTLEMRAERHMCPRGKRGLPCCHILSNTGVLLRIFVKQNLIEFHEIPIRGW